MEIQMQFRCSGSSLSCLPKLQLHLNPWLMVQHWAVLLAGVTGGPSPKPATRVWGCLHFGLPSPTRDTKQAVVETRVSDPCQHCWSSRHCGDLWCWHSRPGARRSDENMGPAGSKLRMEPLFGRQALPMGPSSPFLFLTNTMMESAPAGVRCACGPAAWVPLPQAGPTAARVRIHDLQTTSAVRL